MDNTNIDLIRSHMDTIILRTLQDNDKYGLEILNEIKNLSDDLYTVKQPTLYSSLKRLETQGLVLSCPGEETKGANRTYYRLTDEGRAFLEADQSQWEFARTIIDKLLSDKEFDKDAEKPFEPSDYRPLTKRTKKETEEKVVVKYIEIEKPVYIDRNTGAKIDNYSPNEDNELDDNFANVNNFAVYNNQDNTEDNEAQATFLVKDEHISTEEYCVTENIEQITEPLNDYNQNNIDNNNIEQNVTEEYDSLKSQNVDDNYNSNSYDLNNQSSYDNTQLTEPDYYNNDYNSKNHIQKINNEINHNDYIDNNIDYVGMIEEVIAVNEKTRLANNEIAQKQAILDEYDGEITMAELKQNLAKKNITLKNYQKSNSITYYSGKFYYSNKLLRDWSWITYTIYLAFILLTYLLGKDAGMQWGYSLGFALVGLLFPIGCTIVWSNSPLRKKRNNLTLNNALLTSIILLIAFMVVILIIAFFGVKIDTTKPEQYIPALVVPICSLTLLPLSVMIYATLFKIKNYHLK